MNEEPPELPPLDEGPAKVQQRVNERKYNAAEAEQAFRSIIQMCHAAALLNLGEIKRWILIWTDEGEASKVAGEEIVWNEKQLESRVRVLKILDNLADFRDTLKETGIPPVPQQKIRPDQPQTPNAQLPTAKRH
jgi:hypothetical protein